MGFFFFFFYHFFYFDCVHIVMSLEDELTVARKEVGKERDLRETMEKVREQIGIFSLLLVLFFLIIYFYQRTFC